MIRTKYNSTSNHDLSQTVRSQALTHADNVVSRADRIETLQICVLQIRPDSKELANLIIKSFKVSLLLLFSENTSLARRDINIFRPALRTASRTASRTGPIIYPPIII